MPDTLDYSQLRHYSDFGKFEGGLMIDTVVYNAMLDGWDDESESQEDGGMSDTLFRGGFELDSIQSLAKEMDEDEAPTTAEMHFLTQIAGCILHISSDGFVSVDYYETSKGLEKAWEECREYYDDEPIDVDE